MQTTLFALSVITASIFAVGYIDHQTLKTELIAQNISNYSAFETITPEELHLEKIKFEIQMKEMQTLIDNTK